MDNFSKDLVYIIKMKNQATILDDFRAYLNDSSCTEKPWAYYNLTESTSAHDKDVFESMQMATEYKCALIDYRKDEICCIYWCVCKKYEAEGKRSIHCRLRYKTENKAIIMNFVYNLHLNLETDFPADSFVNYEQSRPLIKQMQKLETKPFVQEKMNVGYKELAEESALSPLAQKNQYCRRKYNLRQPHQERSEFQRDYDRIIYSKAFRRMVDKAQIFSSMKGDHYRTRMTHTLIVCQIAKSISNRLKLNSSLSEAIAIGHDLGHTPFGHQGERTLHAILTGKEGFEVDDLPLQADSPKSAACQYPYGGFKHNYQSVRVASYLESQYPEIEGLDLSEQTLNGMWMHTNKEKILSICDFSDGFLTENGDVAFTLEGQAVAVADEIAQRCHDIDDAFSSHLISPEEFAEYLALKKSSELKSKIDVFLRDVEKLEDQNRLFCNKNELIYSQISSIIVNYFIDDVCSATCSRIETYDVKRFDSDDHTVRERLVWFSDAGGDLCKYLESIITKKVINSHEVTVFDQNGSNIILALFKAYYKNPMLLHEGTLQRIWNEYREQNFEVVCFKEGKPQLIRDEWKRITSMKIPVEEEKRTEENIDVLKKRIILVRGICDFISGMTDSYAINEYHKIIP